MSEADRETLVDIRNIVATIHDRRCGAWQRGQCALSDLEMAAIRDCLRRINEVITNGAKAALAATPKKKGGGR